MFGSLGVSELLFIFTLALLIFGPRKLPEIGRTIGKGLAEFRKASNDLKRTINAEMIEEEVRAVDPRRILREELDGPKNLGKASEPPASSAESPSSSAPAAAEGPVPGSSDEKTSVEQVAVPSRAPGTISRGSVSEDGMLESAVSEEAKDRTPEPSAAEPLVESPSK